MIEILHSEKVFRGKAFDVRRDRVSLPNGNIAQLEIVEHLGSVVLLPVDDQGQIWLVRQYRHATAQELLELPAGVLHADEEPTHCAHRELREETGMAAENLQKIGEFFLAPGYSTEYMVVYHARQLRPDPLPMDADEILRVEKIPSEQVFELAKAGQIRDCKTLAALLLARLHQIL